MLLDAELPVHDEASSDMDRIVAWAGSVELQNAAWSSDSGRTVEMRLIEKPGEGPSHPFAEYQKRRNGRLGQRFHAAIVAEDTQESVYDGEMMLAAWKNDHEGKFVKFWLDEEADRHPFAGYQRRTKTTPGSRFAAVFVLIDEHGAVDGVQEEMSKEPKKRKLSAQAHLMITSELFCRYLRERCEYTRVLHSRGRDWTPKDARAYVKYLIKVDSLADIDWNQEAAARFHDLVRKPFARYNGQE